MESAETLNPAGRRGWRLLALAVAVLGLWLAAWQGVIVGDGTVVAPIGQESMVVGRPAAYPLGEVTASTSLTFTAYLPVVLRRYPPQTVFGAEFSPLSDAGGLAQMASAATWARRASVLWLTVEPTQGNRDWNALGWLEGELLAAAAYKMQVVLVVKGTPAWAQARPPATCGPIKRDNFGDFGSFLRQLVTRYSGPPYNVKYWEIWNEPDVDSAVVPPDSEWGCWGDRNDPYYGGGYYADLLKAVYPQIKAADPQSQVLVGGLLLDCDPVNPPTGKNCAPSRFLEGILQNGGKGSFDGVSYHAYDYYWGSLGAYTNLNWHSSYTTTGTVVAAKTNFLKGVLNAYGASDKFLMNTEMALLCGTCANDAVYETTKAYYLAQGYAAAISLGLRANFWYSVFGWRDSGLLNPDLTPRPAYTAYHVARRALVEAAFVRGLTASDLGGAGGVRGYEFNRGDRRIWVLWSLDGATHVATLPGTPLAAYDVMGVPIPASTSLSIDVMPRYLEWSP